MGMMVTFAPDAFASLTPAQRRDIRAAIAQAASKIQSAQAKIPRTQAGVEAKELLIEANDWLFDLHNAISGDTQ